MDNSMKITAGLGSIDEYERFVQAGADEFFCGYVPFSWAEKYGTVMPLNRREVLCCNVQLGAYSELEILSRMVKKYKKRSARRDSNPRPQPWQGCALPTELFSQLRVQR